MTKLLSAKELLEVVRTAQADAQAAGGGAKWPPRMALGGRSGPRKRAVERARERDAQNVPDVKGAAPFRVQRGGTIPVMEAVRLPPVAPLQAPPPPFGMASSAIGPSAPAAAPAPVPEAPMPAVELPPASAILAAMRAKGGGAAAAPPVAPEPPAARANVLPIPREPEPLELKTERLAIPDALPSNVAPPGRRRARTQPDPRAQAALARAAADKATADRLAAERAAVEKAAAERAAARAAAASEEPPPASPMRSMAALFPPTPARDPEPPPPARSPARTLPEPAVARQSSPPIAREEPEEKGRVTVPIDLPDLEIEVTQAPRRAAIPKATADVRARDDDEEASIPMRDRALARTTRVDRGRLEGDRRAEPADERRPEPGRDAAKETRRERTGGASALSAFAKLASTPKEERPAAGPTGGATGAAALGAMAAPAAPTPVQPAPPIDISWLGAKPAWAPESAPLDEKDEGSTPVALSQDETIVLLNYDAQSSLEAISEKTGFSVFKVERIVERLMDQGVFEDLPVAPVEKVEKKFHAPNRDIPPVAPPPSMMALASAEMEPPPDSLEGPPTEIDPHRNEGPDIEVSESDDDDDDDLDEELPPASGVADDEDEPSDAELEANIRKLYETKLSRLDADQRVAIATEAAVGAVELFALVFDKDPAVAKALFENVHFLTDHARFAAFHHVTSFGIERLATRNELVKDPMVQRRLLRNAHTGELVVRRILAPKRLLDVYKITNDRDVPDRQRMIARGSLRQKFQTADPEDRLQLLWNTEGRALTLLSGCPIDSKTTALFCARPVVSLIMVQNFAKFGATPPGILSHFLKQNLVRRQIGIRNMLLKHPNCPSDAKKQYY